MGNTKSEYRTLVGKPLGGYMVDRKVVGRKTSVWIVVKWVVCVGGG